MEYIENNYGDIIYICANADSGAYLEETDLCGNCEWEQNTNGGVERG